MFTYSSLHYCCLYIYIFTKNTTFHTCGTTLAMHMHSSVMSTGKSNPYALRSRTTTFSSQSATSILDATLLLYVVFFDLNRFLLSSLYVSSLPARIFFHVHVLLFILPFVPLLYSLLLTLLHVHYVLCQ